MITIKSYKHIQLFFFSLLVRDLKKENVLRLITAFFFILNYVITQKKACARQDSKASLQFRKG